MKIALIVLVSVGCILALLALWRLSDLRADRAEAARLQSQQDPAPATFDPAMVAGLPEPAQRFFRNAIAPGTPLWTVAELRMAGQFGMGDAADPKYMDMTAWQVLAPPEGFVWQMRARQGGMRMSGSDSGTWTRFWLMGVIPVARFGGTEDHRRSAFGRYAAEAVFWTPAALLPGPGVSWEPVSDDTARVTLRHGDLEQAVDLTVDADGRATRVFFMRWSNANPEKTWQLQPFGGYLSEEREFRGYRLPTHVEAGNFFETDAYFPFFVADVSDIRFGPAGAP